jgi:hypothetical protein
MTKIFHIICLCYLLFIVYCPVFYLATPKIGCSLSMVAKSKSSGASQTLLALTCNPTYLRG